MTGAGQYVHRITVESYTVTQDSYGQDVRSYSDVGTFWCRVEQLRGAELYEARQRWAEADYKITMQRQSGITFTTLMRGTWNGKTLDIKSVDDPGDSPRPVVTMHAKEVL